MVLSSTPFSPCAGTGCPTMRPQFCLWAPWTRFLGEHFAPVSVRGLRGCTLRKRKQAGVLPPLGVLDETRHRHCARGTARPGHEILRPHGGEALTARAPLQRTFFTLILGLRPAWRPRAAPVQCSCRHVLDALGAARAFSRMLGPRSPAA